MKPLHEMSDEELREELNRRDRERAISEIPQPEPTPNWAVVEVMAIARRDEVVSGDYHEDNDDPQYFFEAVMKAVFGDDYFTWENKQV